MGHVDHQQRTDLIGNGAQLVKLDRSRISGGAGNDQLRLAFQCDAADLVIVDLFRLGRNAVGNKIEIGAAHVHGAAVGQMAAVGEAHAHDRVPGLEHREVDRHVGLRAAVGLNVCVLSAEKLAGSFAGKLFHDIHILAAAVVPLSRITLGILVRQAGAHCGHYGGRNKVLTGNQLNVRPLAAKLQLDGLGHLGVNCAYYFQFHSGLPPLHQ